MQTKKDKKRTFEKAFDVAQDAHCDAAKEFKESTSTSSPNNKQRAPNHARQPSTSNSHREQTNDKKASRIIQPTEHDESDTEGSDVDHDQQFETKRKKSSSRDAVTHVSRTSAPRSSSSADYGYRWRERFREDASPAARVPPPPPPVQPVVDHNDSDYKELFKEKLHKTSGCMPIPCCGFCNLWCALRAQIVLEVLTYVSILCGLITLGQNPRDMEQECIDSMEMSKTECEEQAALQMLKAFCMTPLFLIGIVWNLLLWRALHHCKATYFMIKFWIDVVFLLLSTVESGGAGLIFYMLHLYRMYMVYSWAKHLENGGTFTRDWKMKMD